MLTQFNGYKALLNRKNSLLVLGFEPGKPGTGGGVSSCVGKRIVNIGGRSRGSIGSYYQRVAVDIISVAFDNISGSMGQRRDTELLVTAVVILL